MPKHSWLLMLMFTINPQLIQYYSLLMYGRCQGQYIGGKVIINTNLKLSKLISNGEKEKKLYSEEGNRCHNNETFRHFLLC